MQLAIFHYHLNRGGVTSVVENHLRSLARLPQEEAPTRVAIVYGGRAAAWNVHLADELPFDCELIAVPELDYDHLRSTNQPLGDALSEVLRSFDRESTVLHLHNHCLGKNAAMAPIVCHLADDGWRLLLQIHDFAEDLRPENYQHMQQEVDQSDQLPGQLYPQAAQIHYAVLNRRDKRILSQAGIAEQQLHLLPNPVKPAQRDLDDHQVQAYKSELYRALDVPVEHQFVLYPVRPIRRKNVGELVLWSMLADNATFAVTLAPLNPQEQPTYQRWVEFAAELDLSVRFEVASKTELPFEQIYAASDVIITTSVAEGFGMVYLEASLAGRPLIGRSLPGVCDDFAAAGMRLPGLSEVMAIPVEAIDLAAMRQAQLNRIEQLRADYGLPPASLADFQALESCFSGDAVDFGRLESNQQRDLLRRLKDEAELRRALCALNPQVQAIGARTDKDFRATLDNNRRVIAQHYSLEVIGQRLGKIYGAILASDCQRVARKPAIAGAVLDQFVHPSQLFPIRLEL